MGHRESPWRRALPAEQTRHPEGSFEGHLAQDPVGRRTERSCNGGIPCQQPFEEAHGMTPIRNGGIPPCLELVEEANGVTQSGAASGHRGPARKSGLHFLEAGSPSGDGSHRGEAAGRGSDRLIANAFCALAGHYCFERMKERLGRRRATAPTGERSVVVGAIA